MKVKVKGLVFVGFAAMIFAANAMAAATDANTVTSRAYTEATYQKKATADYKVSKSDGTWNDLATEVTENGANAVTAGAIKTYVDNAITNAGAPSGDSFELTSHKLDGTSGNTIGATTSGQDGNDTTMYPSAAAVKEYVGSEISGALQNGVDGTGYVTATYDSTDNETTVALDPNQMTTTYDTTNGLDSASTHLVTEGVIAAAIAASESATTYTSDGTTITKNGNRFLANTTGGVGTGNDNLVTGGQVQTALDGKQNLQSGDTYQVSKNGSWTAANGAVSAGDHIAKIDNADGSVTVRVDDITTAAADINSTDSGLTTGAAVYNYVQSQTNGNTIPAQDPALCDSTHPCALINENGTLTWQRIAQPGA